MTTHRNRCCRALVSSVDQGALRRRFHLPPNGVPGQFVVIESHSVLSLSCASRCFQVVTVLLGGDIMSAKLLFITVIAIAACVSPATWPNAIWPNTKSDSRPVKASSDAVDNESLSP